MRFIKIDPFDSRVDEHLTPIALDSDFLAKQLNCRLVEAVHLADGIDLWIDEEGLLNETGEQRYFAFKGHSRLFAGIGILTGLSRMGDTVSLPRSITFEEVAPKVLFLDGDEAVEDAIQLGQIERPQSVMVIGSHSEIVWQWEPHRPQPAA